MTILIEHLKWQHGSPRYVSFWVRLMWHDKERDSYDYLSVSGWRYYPDTGKLSTPCVIKGQGRFLNTTRMSPNFYQRVGEEITRVVGGQIKEVVADEVEAVVEGLQHTGEAAPAND